MSERELAEEVALLRAALAAERAKAEAFAQLSHELRTLLSGVTGITSLLLETELLPEQRDYAKRIRGFSDALVELVNNVLDLSKLEAGKFEIERVDFDVRKAVDEVGELLAERAQAKGIELVTQVAAGVPSGLRGDPGKVRQILINLVSNAVKFTDRGEVVVRATVGEDRGDHVVVRVEVQDTGVGISPEGQARLFQPFTQVHAAQGRSFGGSGLGLALARQLVEAMGGTIGVASRPGEGSTFHFTVPFGRKSPVERHAIPRVDVAGRRVIAVSASAAIRAVLGEMIGVLGASCDVADDGERGVSALQAAAREGRPYDVALLDANLADGAELLRALDADEALASLPVVLMSYPGQRFPTEDRGDVPPMSVRSLPTHSATTGRSSQRHAVRVVTHLAKPVRQSQLHACLWTLMGGAVETVVPSDVKLRDAPAPESRRSPVVRPGSARRAPGRTPTPGPSVVVLRAGARPDEPGAPQGPGSSPGAGVPPAPTSQPGASSHRTGLRLDEPRPAPGAGHRPGLRADEPPSAPGPVPSPAAAEVDDRPAVLLVEDNEVNRRVAKVTLEKHGYRVDIACDGIEAIEATARTAYAAVLMDCQMPRCDGYTATAKIRERDAKRRRVPIIAMTANAGPGARERCLGAGMDDYVAKPVSAQVLGAVLRLWVPRSTPEGPPAPPPPRRVSAPIDLGMLRELRCTQGEGEPDIVAEVTAIFLREAPERLAGLREAVGRGDFATAGRIAHTLKGSAGHIGARRLALLCSRFDEKARVGPFDATFSITAVAEELDHVCAALAAEMDRAEEERNGGPGRSPT
jgi:CheY-like chemotaxis protein/nitrogen-specific signal transduction histidine kinase